MGQLVFSGETGQAFSPEVPPCLKEAHVCFVARRRSGFRCTAYPQVPVRLVARLRLPSHRRDLYCDTARGSGASAPPAAPLAESTDCHGFESTR